MRVSARKALGQHFIRDAGLLARIANATGAGPDDVVLEIGPGPGGLTVALADTGATVVAVERDGRLLAALRRRVAGRDVAVVEGDALALDWPALVAPWTAAGKRWLVVGNIPYNITSPLLAKALSDPFPSGVAFLVQREVAHRVVAAPGSREYGALSIGIQAVADAAIAFDVGRAAFVPAPKVDSALLQLIPRSSALVPSARAADFRRLVTSVFSYRRKRMLKAVREALTMSAEDAGAVLDRAGIDADVRPEQVDVAGFVRLFHAVGSRASGSRDVSLGVS